MTDELIVSGVSGATGILENIFSHKIDKLHKYFLERELTNETTPEQLQQTLRVYFEKLSKRVSEITTIAFPQHKLELNKIYEPLSLIGIHKNIYQRQPLFTDDQYNNKPFDITNALKTQSGSYVIIDGAGMGKTTFARYLVQEILYKSEKIPILFDLRKIDINGNLIEQLIKELDFPWEFFSRDLFYKLLSINKFIIILDGFDEITPSHQEEISKQINDFSIKCGGNSIVLTTRPQEIIPDLLNGKSFKFDELTIDQVKSILLKYDQFSSSKVGERLIHQLDSVPNDFIKTPLIVSLLYKTFGFNNSIANRLSTFYDDVYQALYKGHDLINKGSFSRKKLSNLDYEEFRKLLRAFCFYMSVNRVTSFTDRQILYTHIAEAVRLSGTTPSSINNYLSDLLTTVPLMVKEGNEYKFIHKTIMEYFSAEYIILHPESTRKLMKIFESNSFQYFEKIADFIMDLNRNLFNSVITKHFAERLKSKISNDDDPVKNILITSTELLNCKVAFFTKNHLTSLIEKHKTKEFNSLKNNDAHAISIAVHRTEPFPEYPTYTSTWSLIEEDNFDFIVAFAWVDKERKFHNRWFYEISKNISPDEIFKFLDANERHERIFNNETPINVWLDIIPDEHVDLLRSKVSLGFFRNISHKFHLTEENDCLYYFSKSKIDFLLSELKQQSLLSDEIDNLLE